MTSIEWLAKMGYVSADIVEQAKEMHKQEIIDARDNMQKSCIELANKINPHLFEFNKKDAEQYYNETYGSKGSDVTSSQTEISDEEIEKVSNTLGDDYYASELIMWEKGAKWYREQLKTKKD
jgi:hypothetical protein